MPIPSEKKWKDLLRSMEELGEELGVPCPTEALPHLTHDHLGLLYGWLAKGLISYRRKLTEAKPTREALSSDPGYTVRDGAVVLDVDEWGES